MDLEKILAALGPLGEKLSTTSAHVWEILVRNSYVIAFQLGLSAVKDAAVSFLLLWGAKIAHKGFLKACGGDSAEEVFLYGLAGTLLGTIALLFIVHIFEDLGNMGGDLINPEYLALKTILSLAGK